jgi:hypothetical protein
MKKKVGARSLTRNILGIKGRAGASGWTRMNSQGKLQDEINLQNQKKKVITANRMEMVWQT